MKNAKKSHLTGLFAILIVIMVATLACGTETTITGLNVETQVALTLGAVNDNVVEATVAPAGNVVEFNGITFTFDPSIAQSVSVSIDPGISGELGGTWYNTPQSEMFDFVGYVTGEKFHDPHIMVFSVDEYIAANEKSTEVIAKLQQYIASKPNIPAGALPFLPNWNAAQLFQPMPAFISFQNGQGIRFLTEFGQYAAPVNNTDLFYTFQGITNDGKYYISAILPVTHPSLPADSNVGEAIQNKLYEDYDGYLNETLPALAAQPLDSFTPSIALLDAMIQSLKIH
jgi:hypothetical protein